MARTTSPRLLDATASVDTALEPALVYEPHLHTLPPLRPYIRDLWGRRRFLVHLARANLKAQHYDTVAGQLWTLLNPVLLASVYFFLVAVVLQAQANTFEYLGSLLAGLFAFYYTRNTLLAGSKSVLAGGSLLLNSAFPRLLLPLSASVSAFLQYMPMLAVYAVFHVAAGFPIGPQLLTLPLIVALHAVFSTGLGVSVAVATIYLRDTTRLLPYATRVWLYMSPVLWSIEQVPDTVRPYLEANPIYPVLATWHQVLIDGRMPDPWLLGQAALWGTAAFVFGSLLFVSREREFAIRL